MCDKHYFLLKVTILRVNYTRENVSSIKLNHLLQYKLPSKLGDQYVQKAITSKTHVMHSWEL